MLFKVEALQTTASRLRRFAAQVNPDVPAIDEALAPLRALLKTSGVDFLIVGGLAVVHHGYQRLTVDLDVLIAEDGHESLDAHLQAFDFIRTSRRRLKHEPTGVQVDLLTAGDSLIGPRTAPPLPSPDTVGRSEQDPDIISLHALLELKLDAGRRQDITDVVELLKRVEDRDYLFIEAEVRRERRSELAALRQEALEEASWETANET